MMQGSPQRPPPNVTQRVTQELTKEYHDALYQPKLTERGLRRKRIQIICLSSSDLVDPNDSYQRRTKLACRQLSRSSQFQNAIYGPPYVLIAANWIPDRNRKDIYRNCEGKKANLCGTWRPRGIRQRHRVCRTNQKTGKLINPGWPREVRSNSCTCLHFYHAPAFLITWISDIMDERVIGIHIG